jgi:hypothetical protein
MEQRLGRMVRQYNQNEKTQLFRYVTKGTFDAYSYQLLENKQKPISQIMSGKTPARKCSDVDEVSLSYAEVKQLCTGDERIKEVMELKTEISRLKALQTDYNNRRAAAEDICDSYAENRKSLTESITKLLMDYERVQLICSQGSMPFEITLKEKLFHSETKTEAGKALETICAEFRNSNDSSMNIGSIHGFSIELRKTAITGELNAFIHGESVHFVPFTISAPHNLRKLETVLATVDKRLDSERESLYELDKNHNLAQTFLQKPFRHTNELKVQIERHTKLSDELQKEADEKLKSNKKDKNVPETSYFSKSKREALAVACTLLRENKREDTPEKKHDRNVDKDEPDMDDD